MSLPSPDTSSAPAKRRFAITGMDCAACVKKIEVAVGRIDGARDVSVGLQSQSLSVALDDPAKADEVVKAVRSLGYRIAPAERAEKDSPADRDHSDHGHPIEGPWWTSSRGRIVLVTVVLIAIAYGVSLFRPENAQFLFLAAAAIGTVPVARRAFSALRLGSFFTIEMLMTIAVVGAVILGAHEEASLVVCLFAVGELLEGIAAGRARSGIKALAEIAPKTAMVETGADLVETPIEAIGLGTIVVVRPGERVPADGTIVSGASSLDESALTGESVPRSKGAGDMVFAGSINTEAALRIRVDKPAKETLIARVVELVEEAADAKAPSERFIDTFARWYMPIICLVAIAVAIGPPLLWQEEWSVWIYRALALLLIGCPCALVISTPASIASALAAGARRGLLVKGGGVLEAIGKIRHIAFDKTGTLTEGRPKVTDVVALADMSEDALLRIAAAAEAGSTHPLAIAIVAHAKAKGLRFTAAESRILPGKGVAATVEGQAVIIGAAGRIGVTDERILRKAAELEGQGKSVSAIVIADQPAGLIALRDEPREDAKTGLAELSSLGLRPIMLTGDNKTNADAVGRMLGMTVRAELLPEDKLAVIKSLAMQGGVAKVGDGVNDAPALAAATVGIAMGSGTDVALEAADAAMLNNRIGDIAGLVRLSRRTLAVIQQNVTIALGLKAVFLVTTILGITGLWVAILADTGATVIVTANALRLLRNA